MSYTISLSEKVQKQLGKIRGNQKLLQKLFLILDEISIDPYDPNHKFERLKHDLSGLCSKRLDQKNRILYHVKNAQREVTIISVLGHYFDT